ncbi:MAG: sigma-70 family RNA polymerase sigma factor [Caldilineaceae bacterium]|nr:sigma-70 family RNA polymerase sigma factor [Caldilineaceae bacterium]MCB9140381.1 sigma-70 family RNA polymerase sigma factor [Caldilineaceae bacterium]
MPPDSESRSDQEFLKLLQAGDEVAWAQFIQEQSKRLYSYLHYNLPSEQDREDVLMDTLAACVRALQRFDGKDATISTFVYSIAQRKVADFWRKHKNTKELPETIAGQRMSNKKLILEEALNELPDNYRQALLLRYQVGLNVTELAESMDLTYKAAESLLSRSRRALSNLLDEDYY